jgi:hypothetical protein
MARIIAYACLAVSGTLAAVYGYSTGNSELYGLLRAVGWGMVAVVGGSAPAWLFHHLDARSYGRALATALAGAVCFCVTIYGSMGGITGSSDKVAAERARMAEAIKDDRDELKRIAADRAKLPDFRPIGTVEADLEVARAGRPYRSSDGCTPGMITTKSVREGCEAFRKLEGELEVGRAAGRLEQTAATIRGRLATGTAVQTVDPGATAVSLIVGTSPDNVAAWSALLGSLALELAGMIAMMRAESGPVRESPGAQLGSTIASNPESAPALDAETPQRRPKVIAGITLIDPPKPSASADTVGRFMLACLKRAKGEEAPGGAIYGRYQRWCSEQQPALAALDPRQFAQQFAERCERVGIRTRRDGRKIYCLDVRLVA